MEDLGRVAGRCPVSLSLLSDGDQSGYLLLSARLSAHRFSRAETLELVREFCVRDSPSDWKRCHVCGVFFLPSGCIAFDFRSLQNLVGMSKSAWFGGLRSAGYSAAPDCATELRGCAPLVAASPHLAREWAFRSPPRVPHRKQRQCGIDPDAFCLGEKVKTVGVAAFFDDPFSLPPLFLFDDCRKSVCTKTTLP
jgi:hypothetical protein